MRSAVGKTVCDRSYGTSLSTTTGTFASGSALLTGAWLAFYPPKACVAALPEPVVPEVPLPVLLGVTGALTGVAVVATRRRLELRPAVARRV